VSGFGNSTISGALSVNDPAADNAQTSLTAAIGALSSMTCDTDLSGTDLGTLTLLSGVFCYSVAAQLTGTLTLNAQGDPDAVFVFKIGTTLTTASSSILTLINGGSVCNIYWLVGKPDMEADTSWRSATA